MKIFFIIFIKRENAFKYMYEYIYICKESMRMSIKLKHTFEFASYYIEG